MNDKLATITNLFEGKEIRSVWDAEAEDFFEEETGSKVVTKSNSLNYQYIDENKLIEK